MDVYGVGVDFSSCDASFWIWGVDVTLVVAPLASGWARLLAGPVGCSHLQWNILPESPLYNVFKDHVHL